MLPLVALSALCHELGHLAALGMMGAGVERFQVRPEQTELARALLSHPPETLVRNFAAVALDGRLVPHREARLAGHGAHLSLGEAALPDRPGPRSPGEPGKLTGRTAAPPAGGFLPRAGVYIHLHFELHDGDLYLNPIFYVEIG